ncbi:hypothetical protein PoB_004798100 [Plakobranchus ocellatus]|uniref:Uncharacterized protein n=1 Tax=Plakobranchus ocellatus TaxID=259542 RepID=A0AAV4BDP6_9GAST|nr:hypothetical protein PoB_004798100 [Plakobranchus ocellatus]
MRNNRTDIVKVVVRDPVLSSLFWVLASGADNDEDKIWKKDDDDDDDDDSIGDLKSHAHLYNSLPPPLKSQKVDGSSSISSSNIEVGRAVARLVGQRSEVRIPGGVRSFFHCSSVSSSKWLVWSLKTQRK